MRTRFLLTLSLSFLFAVGFIVAPARGQWESGGGASYPPGEGGPTGPGEDGSSGGGTAPAPSGPDHNPLANTGALKSQIETAGSYDAHTGNATRIVPDLRVPGAPGVYGLDFVRYYNSLRYDRDKNLLLDPAPEPNQPTDFGAPGWSHSWRWSADFETYAEQPEETQERTFYHNLITITFPDGRASKFKIVRSSFLGDFGHACGTPSYPCEGPPYYADRNETNWQGGKHDRLANMAEDGSNFWLYHADGGSVHFTDGPHGYLATKVYDPNGFLTTLHYNANWELEWVVQESNSPEGGRRLHLTWANGKIQTVQSAVSGVSGFSQMVEYRYPDGLLREVVYHGDPGNNAEYTYLTIPPPLGFHAAGPLLATANDPRFEGPMRTISYAYAGGGCTPVAQPSPGYPGGKKDYYYASPTAISQERYGAINSQGQVVPGEVVSHFGIGCFDGTRTESNGLGGFRKFFFGGSARGPGSFSIQGYQLARLTDFDATNPLAPGVPFAWQNYEHGHPRQIWDGRGILTETFHLDGSGFPTEVRNTGAQDGSSYLYDRTNPGNSEAPDPNRIQNPYRRWLFRKRDENGAWTTYTRDHRRRVKRIDYSGGSSETFVYDNYQPDGNNQVTHHWLASGALKRYEYDGRGRLEREWDDVDGPENAVIYTYDSLDRVETISHPWSRAKGADWSVKMSYNARHQVTREEYPATDSSGISFKTYEYNKYGDCTAIIDELNHRRTYTYDMYGRCTSLEEQLDGLDAWENPMPTRRWDWTYDRWIDGIGERSAASHTGKEWRIQVGPAFNYLGERHMTARAHDVNNRLVVEQTGWIQRPHPAPIGDWYWTHYGETHYFSYDANGNKKTFTDPRGRVTEYEYDLRDRLKKTIERAAPGELPGEPRVTQTTYDLAGNKLKVIFPDGRQQQWAGYDAFGQAWQFTDERNQTTHLNYQWGPMKILDNVITYRQRDYGGGTEPQITNFDSDPLGRLRWTYFPDGSSELKDYHFGQLDVFKTRNNETKRIVYDARGREDYHYWDANAAPSVDRNWDKANRLTTISNPVATIEYGYDAAGQVLSEKVFVAGADGPAQTDFRRYGTGSLWNIRYPNGMWVARDYRPQGELQTVWDHGPNDWRMVINYNYLADGKVDFANYGNGVVSDLNYDGRGMISSVQHRRGSGENLSYRQYFRDARDRIYAWKKSTANGLNGMENGRGERYEYDPEGQLTRAFYGVPNPEVSGDGYQSDDHFAGWDENWVSRGYDALGNRQGWNVQRSTGWTWYHRRNNGLNQYTDWSRSIMYYDDNSPWAPWNDFPGNGVMMAEGRFTASYNALNQPIAIWAPGFGNDYMWFGYDPLGRCVKRWKGPGDASEPNGATFLYYEGWNLIQDGPSAGSASMLYVHGARVDEIVKQVRPSDDWERFFHYDARTHCTLQTDAFANVVEQYEYDAFGKPYYYDVHGNDIGHSPWGNRFLFTGREWLSELGIYDYRHRMYQPELGRFLQPDPIQFKAGDYNLYRYCHNDPVNKSDPTGLMPDGHTTQQEIQALRDDPKTPSTIIAVGVSALAAPVAAEVAGAGLLTVASRIPAAGRVIAALTGAGAVSRISVPEGHAFLAAVTKEGKIAGVGSIASSHASLVQKVFNGIVPQGASVVTVGKLNGQVFVQTSRTIHNAQVPAPKAVEEAIKKVYK